MKPLALLVVTLAIVAGCNQYLKCDDCGAAYKTQAGHLPVRYDKIPCDNCGGRVCKTTKELSGWDDDRERVR